MSSPATYDDVSLILRLYEMRREERLRTAREWFAAHFHARTMEEFQGLCPAGSDQLTHVRMVSSYWEMVASFITSGVLNEDLFFQSGRELLFCWERLRDLVPHMRAANQDPSAWRHLETVATNYIHYLEKQGSGAYQAFSARVRG